MELTPAERLDLMKFVCSFVWTDLKVTQEERDLVMRTCGQLGLSAEETAQVEGWLEVPPPADEVDPFRIPREHRELFLKMAEAVVQADGKVVPAESESLRLFRDLLAVD
ncbi:MAG TPA: TerB family tellurite resistance protein [bacterium]|nr:TerB family tellurite resistance protein [bacterium]